MASKRITKKPAAKGTKKPAAEKTATTKKPAAKKTATTKKPAATGTKKPLRLRYGLMREDGSWCFEPRFEGMGAFSEGLVAIRAGERWGFADEAGEVVIEPVYDHVYGFFGGAAAVRRDGRWTSIDRAGRELDGWRGAPCEGRVRFSRGGTSSDFEWEPRGGLFGFLDEDGAEVIAPRYQAARDFSEGLAVVQLEATGSGFRFAYLGRDGAVVVPGLDAWEARSFAEGWARIQRLDQTWAFIDRRGQIVLETPYREVSPFEEDRAVVRETQDGPCGYIDRSGRLLTELGFAQAAAFSNGLAAVQRRTGMGASWGFIDPAGEQVIEPAFRDVRPFAAEVAPAAVADAKHWSTTVWGLIDRRGGWVVGPGLAFISAFENGVARFRRGDSWGLFDERGAVVADGFAAIEEGVPLACNRGGRPGKTSGVSGGKWGFVDTAGVEVIPPTLEAVAGPFHQGRVGAARRVAAGAAVDLPGF